MLYGEAIESVFPPIDRRHHVEATLTDASWIVKNPTENPLYTVLNLCRALAVINGGMTPSKIEAAQWALETLPDELHLLIEEVSRRYRTGEPGERLDQRELTYAGRLCELVTGPRAAAPRRATTAGTRLPARRR